MRLKSLNLLLVDDDPDNLDLLSLCLTSEGANVLIARTIATALVRAQAARVDLLLCNRLLSDGDGCALLRRLRERPEWSSLPAVALTAAFDQHCLAPCGFDRLALMPVNLQDLVDAIAELVVRH